jgi:hypothetical protein
MPGLLSTLLIILSLPILTSAACTRAFLQNITTAYVAAQRAGQPSLLASVISPSPNFIYLENNQLASLPAGALSTALKIDFSRSIHDPDQCAAFTELISASDPHPHVIHTRMVFASDSDDSSSTPHQATLIESVVTDEGDWLFNATGTLALNADEKWDAIPVGERLSRAEVQALGDAYFDRFGNASVAVPWGAPCYRLEGGLPARGELGADGECVMVWPSTIVVPYRRYVVDVEMGAVDMFIGFPGLDRTQGQAAMPDSHLFRVERGKIRYCHTASACVVDGCGLNGTAFGRRGTGLRPVSLRG